MNKPTIFADAYSWGATSIYFYDLTNSTDKMRLTAQSSYRSIPELLTLLFRECLAKPCINRQRNVDIVYQRVLHSSQWSSKRHSNTHSIVLWQPCRHGNAWIAPHAGTDRHAYIYSRIHIPHIYKYIVQYTFHRHIHIHTCTHAPHTPNQRENWTEREEKCGIEFWMCEETRNQTKDGLQCDARCLNMSKLPTEALKRLQNHVPTRAGE